MFPKVQCLATNYLINHFIFFRKCSTKGPAVTHTIHYLELENSKIRRFCAYCRINKFREIGLPLLDKSGNVIRLAGGKPKTKLKIKKKFFKCEVCGKKYKHSFNFIEHAKKYGHTTHQCNSCEQSFPTVATLNKHILADHTVKEYKCESCGKEFSIKNSLQVHYETVHL